MKALCQPNSAAAAELPAKRTLLSREMRALSSLANTCQWPGWASQAAPRAGTGFGLRIQRKIR